MEIDLFSFPYSRMDKDPFLTNMVGGVKVTARAAR